MEDFCFEHVVGFKGFVSKLSFDFGEVGSDEAGDEMVGVF